MMGGRPPFCDGIFLLACYCYCCAVGLTIGGPPGARNGPPASNLNTGGSDQDKNICIAKELYFEEHLDHFGFVNDQTFQLRYFLGDQHWNKDGGPILFYTGNEGNVELFCKNTGFMWDLAPEFGAMVVFAEHRYYGKSLPFGADTFKNNSNLNWLTTEQALADYAQLIRHIKETTPGAKSSRVIAFGGSYGGLLSAFMRITYPNVVVGSLAAAAPMYGVSGASPANAYFDALTKDFERVSHQCVRNIRQAFDALVDVTKQAGGYQWLSDTFKLCSPPTNYLDVIKFRSMLILTYESLENVEYPYPANFMANLPAYPVEVACGYLAYPMQGKELLTGLAKLTNLFYNYTGQLECLDFKTPPGAIEATPWGYQVCSELIFKQSSNGSGMIYNVPDNPEVFDNYCYRKFQVRPRRDWVKLHYRTMELETTSNIIFSNGVLDPTIAWSIVQDVSDTVVAINIELGAHHLELRSRNKLDPPTVTAARDKIRTIFRRWLKT